MDLNKAGGTAFPLQFEVRGPAVDPITGATVKDGHSHGHVFVGMTLRDYFAVHAPIMSQLPVLTAETLIGRALPDGYFEKEIFWLDVDAKQRHLWAEAMLRARQESEE
jgi:hypothetical protein